MKIQVIIGTTREGRFGDKPAKWIFQQLSKRKDVDAELLDLRDYPLPFFNEPVSPKQIKDGKYTSVVAAKWAKKIGEADGYIIVTAEYNHGYPAVLKNALDHLYYEWNKKAVGFVGYGSAGGARAIEQLRCVAAELEMVSVRPTVGINWDVYSSQDFDSLSKGAEALIDELLWWTEALKKAREK